MSSSDFTTGISVIRIAPIEGLSLRLRPYGNPRIFFPGEILFQQLEEIRSIFVIESGLVELAVVSKLGNTKIITNCYDGVILGEMGLYQNYINTSQATVIKKSEINVIPIEVGRREFFKDSELALLLFKSLATKLQLTTNQLGIMMLESILSRIAYVLLDYHRSEVQITQEKLAAAVGCSRITVARHLKTLKERGIIKNKRGVIIVLNRQALEELI